MEKLVSMDRSVEAFAKKVSQIVASDPSPDRIAKCEALLDIYKRTRLENHGCMQLSNITASTLWPYRRVLVLRWRQLPKFSSRGSASSLLLSEIKAAGGHPEIADLDPTLFGKWLKLVAAIVEEGLDDAGPMIIEKRVIEIRKTGKVSRAKAKSSKANS